jgi:preprotein translocase subunit Sss1
MTSIRKNKKKIKKELINTKKPSHEEDINISTVFGEMLRGIFA